jgi:hypothetical protein
VPVRDRGRRVQIPAKNESFARRITSTSTHCARFGRELGRTCGSRHERQLFRGSTPHLQKALARGVPVCAVPFGRDQLEVARRVEVAGAGTRLPASRLSPDHLRRLRWHAFRPQLPAGSLDASPTVSTATCRASSRCSCPTSDGTSLAIAGRALPLAGIPVKHGNQVALRGSKELPIRKNCGCLKGSTVIHLEGEPCSIPSGFGWCSARL